MVLKLRGFVLALVPVLLVLGLFGCKSRTPEDIFVAAQKALNGLESYYAKVTYIIVDDEEQREYGFEQWVSMPSSFKIRLTAPDSLAGKTIVSDGKEILIDHPKEGDSLRFEAKGLEQQRPLFIGDFLNSFWSSEDVTKRIHLDDDGMEFVVFACPAPGVYNSACTEELWVYSDKMSPAKLIAYDSEGNVISLIYFESFNEDWKPGENFFCID
ncbi:MAG: hypothetical protein GX352_02340 [Clostridiales bacterium]|nr:hypothetical protein [Clostridiales bacterium]